MHSQRLMIEIDDLYFAYEQTRSSKGEKDASSSSKSSASDKRNILDGINMEVPQGICMCLMGVNGCGKSTLLDCILGEHHPSEGFIAIDGEPAIGMRAKQLATLAAYVPQTHERSFPYSVKHVVLMGRALSDQETDADEDDMIAMRALARCGIEHLADRSYTGLSGGEMQMLMLARALVQQTPLIIMDEPTAHLDFKNQLRFLETVEDLILNEGITVLMATHSPNEAFHLEAANVPVKIAVMAEGKIVRQGSPSEILTSRILRDVFGIIGMVADIDLDIAVYEDREPTSSDLERGSLKDDVLVPSEPSQSRAQSEDASKASNASNKNAKIRQVIPLRSL